MTAKQVTKQAGRVTAEGDELADYSFKMKVGGTEHLVGLAGNIIKILVTIEGRIDPERVRRALPKLKKRHLLLGSKIILDQEGRSWLVTERVPDLELQVYEKRGDLDWLERVSEQDRIPFRMNVGPLARFMLLTSETSSDFVLYMHHVMSDGLSGLYVMEDLLSLIGDPQKELPPLPPPVDIVKSIPPDVGLHTPWIARFVIGRMNARWRRNKVTFSDDDFVKLQEKRYEEKDCTLLLSLTAAETSTLAEKCHMKGVTVNSVLLTALLTAKYAVPALAEVIPDKLRVAVNLRDKLTEDPGRGCGFYAGLVPLHARFSPKKDFEHNLVTIHSEVARKIHDNRELFQGLMVMEMIDPSLFDALAFESYGMLENPMTKRFRRNMAKSSAGITLTNLGRQDFPERFEDLKVRKIIFLAPGPGPFKILQASAFTACGCLHAAFSYTESIFSATVMKDYVSAVEDSLRGFIAIIDT
ncbi:MAG TPA: condensation domain-containing protein [Candidatus Acidoferrales bacterium]|nr:condensation domain-containing protein [Candidatus Acidoferrales bacterium]